MGVNWKQVWYLVDRYSAVVFFPTAALTAIYFDYSYTRNWKKEKELST